MRIVPAVVLLLLFGSLARADEGSLLGKRYVGARIGGYGFRRPQTEGGGWNDCRMNGVGIFGQQALPAGFFLEAGLDAYFTDGRFVAGSGDEDEDGEDRLSGLATGAAGVRFFPGAVVSPYAQVGLGLEATRVAFAGTGSKAFLMPVAFLGVGGDLHVGRLALGTSLRLHAMAQFEPEDGRPSPVAALAAQVQFYALFAP